jgi:hypothetical protein
MGFVPDCDMEWVVANDVECYIDKRTNSSYKQQKN